MTAAAVDTIACPDCAGPAQSTVADPCVFCEIVAEREPAVFVRQWTAAIAIVPLEPVTEGHTLVIPRKHIRDVSEAPAVAGMAMEYAAEIAVPPFNIITSAGREATQSVWHAHLHVVPRRENDGLALPWYSGRGPERVRKLLAGEGRPC